MNMKNKIEEAVKTYGIDVVEHIIALNNAGITLIDIYKKYSDSIALKDYYDCIKLLNDENK